NAKSHGANAARSARANHGKGPAKNARTFATTDEEVNRMRDESEQSKRVTALSVATLFSSNILAGILIGYLLDWWFHTGPWMIVTGVVLGLISAIIGLVRILNSLNRSD